MAEPATKLPSKTEAEAPARIGGEWPPLANLRREIDRLFEDFGFSGGRRAVGRSVFDIEPFWRGELTFGKTPAVDIVEKDKAYEVTADVPGFDEKNIEVKLVNGSLCIKGERKSEKEEKKEGYYLSEREFGSFERSFGLPEGVDTDKIEASLKKGAAQEARGPEARQENRGEVGRLSLT